MGCEPTYKELKSALGEGEDNGGYGCEPTYKELKFFSVERKELENERCEPTYKELKLMSGLMMSTNVLKLRAYL